MTARGRFVARLVTMLIALAGFVTVGALPAAADNSATIQYVALGDSYAAGQGGGDTSTIARRARTATHICSTPKRGSIS